MLCRIERYYTAYSYPRQWCNKEESSWILCHTVNLFTNLPGTNKILINQCTCISKSIEQKNTVSDRTNVEFNHISFILCRQKPAQAKILVILTGSAPLKGTFLDKIFQLLQCLSGKRKSFNCAKRNTTSACKVSLLRCSNCFYTRVPPSNITSSMLGLFAKYQPMSLAQATATWIRSNQITAQQSSRHWSSVAILLQARASGSQLVSLSKSALNKSSCYRLLAR